MSDAPFPAGWPYREDPTKGYRSYAEPVGGEKTRLRPESFADHYSQARQFYVSQTKVEQKHMADALTFELSKVQKMEIRLRMLSHLLNIDEDLAKKVADGLGVTDMPPAADPASPPITDLPASDPLSILKNAPDSFAGRKLGIFATDDADADLLNALKEEVTSAGGMTMLISPKVGGITLSDGSHMEADEKIDGGPSVLFDAVALLISEEGADMVKNDAPSRDFVADAFAHCKFIGYVETAQPLMEKASVWDAKDEGCVALSKTEDVPGFVKTLGKLRHWDREPMVDLDG